MTIDEMIDGILSKMNADWSTLCKIRYIYLEVGKFLYKNTDFFFSIEDKLGKENLSIEKIQDVYDDEKATGDDFSIICKSGSFILKRAFDKAGIESKLVKSMNNSMIVEKDGKKVTIDHWFLAVNDGEKYYFMSLSADLPYIQMGMKTKHFGSHIPYIRDDNGKKVQVYAGEAIKHTVLTEEELFTIDKEINYVNTYYSYNDKRLKTKNPSLNYNDYSFLFIRDAMVANKAYYDLEEEETDFYKKMFDLTETTTLNDFNNNLSDEEWNEWIKKLCQNVLNILEKIIGFKIKVEIDENWEYESWLKKVCFYLEQSIYNFYYKENANIDQSLMVVEDSDWEFGKWSRMLKNTSTRKVNGNYDYYNPLVILDKMNTLIKFIKLKNYKNFSSLLHMIAFHDIDPELVPDIYLQNNQILPNRYVANKFNRLFEKIFSCNDIKTSFNFMEYSEQIVIIKQILNLMFLELTPSNCSNLRKYNPMYNAVNNKINCYPIKNKKDGNYALIFYVIGGEDEADYAFFYNLKTNEFKAVDILKISTEYIIVSNRLKGMIDDLENIEVPLEDIEVPLKK